MTTQYYSGPQYKGRLLGFVLALLLGAIGFAVFAHRARHGMADRIATLLTGRSRIGDNSASAVAEKIQHLGRLANVHYLLSNTLDSSTPLVVQGDLIAGVDLTQLTAENIRIDDSGRGIHVQLPSAQIFSTSLEVNPRAYSTSSVALVPTGQSLTPDLRARAEQRLQQSALDGGILTTAHSNAVPTVSTLLRSLGFETVEVN